MAYGRWLIVKSEECTELRVEGLESEKQTNHPTN